MKTKKWMFVIGIASLALAMGAPAFASGTEWWALNDSERPGSVIVFHKFITGSFVDAQSGRSLPRTQFEISITCPKNATCELFQQVRLRAHWVCPPGRDENSSTTCHETNFDLFGTVNGTIFFNPENLFPTNHIVPPPPCERGYLIAWAVSNTEPPAAISFDGLIGDAVLRDSQTSARAYNALPIQACDWCTPGQPIDDGNGQLDFNGNEYRAITGKIFAPIPYESNFPPTETSLTLLTLDVRSNLENPRTDVGLNFYSFDEQVVSTSRNFYCWDQFRLNDLEGHPTQNFSFKGHVESTYAQQNGVPATVVGIVEAVEGFTIPITAPAQPLPPVIIDIPVGLFLCPAVVPPGCRCVQTGGTFGPARITCNVTAPPQLLETVGTRDYSYSMYHDGNGVPTTFVPTGGPIPPVNGGSAPEP